MTARRRSRGNTASRRAWVRLALASLMIASAAPALRAGVAGALPAPTVIARGPSAPGGSTARVAVVGDSLMVGAASEADRLLGAFSLALDARISRTIVEAPAALDRVRAWSADVVVIALGTNDGFMSSRYAALISAARAESTPSPS